MSGVVISLDIKGGNCFRQEVLPSKQESIHVY